jgi:hypothetical protein
MLEEERVAWRCFVWTSLELGASRKDIEGLVGSRLPRSTLRSYIEAFSADWRDHGVPFDRRRPGRPSETDDATKDSMVNDLKAGSSVRKVAARYGKSKDTVGRVAKEKGVRARLPAYRPFLTESAMTRRLQYAKDCMVRPKDWFKRVLWTDESAVKLTPSLRRHVWVDEGVDPDAVPHFHWAQSVWVWAGISWEGATALVVLDVTPKKTFTGEEYQVQVLHRVKNLTKKLNIDNMLLMEDGARVHNTPANQRFKADRKIQTFPGGDKKWPPTSPDLNPIENLWSEMKYSLHELDQYPTTREDMISALKEFWSTVTQEKCQALIGSYMERVRAVIEKEGGETGY